MPPPHSELWLSTVSKVTLSAQLNSHDSPPNEQEPNPQPPEYGRVNYIPAYLVKRIITSPGSQKPSPEPDTAHEEVC